MGKKVKQLKARATRNKAETLGENSSKPNGKSNEFFNESDEMPNPLSGKPKYGADKLLEKVGECIERFDYTVADKFCQRALETEPDNVVALEMMGFINMQSGDLESARSNFNKAISLKPDEGHNKYMQLGQISTGLDAIQCYTKGVEIMKQQLTAEDDRKKSMGACAADKESDLTVRDVSCAYCAIAELYLTDSCFEEDADVKCYENITQAIAQDNTNPEVYQILASYWLCKEDKQAAGEALDKGLSLWLPVLREAHKNKDEPSTSAQSVDPVLTCPVTYAVRISYSKTAMELGNYEVAQEVLGFLMLEDSQVVEVWYLLGWLNYLRGEEYHSDARYHLTKGRELAMKTSCDDEQMIEHMNELLSEIGPAVAMKRSCEVCQVPLNSEQQATAHYAGKVHAQKVALLQGGQLGLSPTGKVPGARPSQLSGSGGQSGVTGVKRPAPNSRSDAAMGVSEKKIKLEDKDLEENPLQVLRMYRPNLEFTVVSQTGAQHCPKFTLRIEVNGRRFEATGPRKKTTMETLAQQVMNVMGTSIRDDLNHRVEEREELEAAEERYRLVLKERMGPQEPTEPTEDATEEPVIHCRNSVKVFQEACPKHTFDKPVPDVMNGGFKVTAVVHGTPYTGFGATSTLAKSNAAAEILKSLFNMELELTDDGYSMFLGDYNTVCEYRKQFLSQVAAMTPKPTVRLAAASVMTGAYTNVAVTLGGESPVMILNELYVGQVAYETLEHTPEYPDLIVVRVSLENQVFQGVGANTKIARQNAAIEALVSLKKSGALARVIAQRAAAKTGMKPVRKARGALAALQNWHVPHNPPIKILSEEDLKPSNPLSKLNQAYPGTVYTPIDANGLDTESPERFKMAVDVDGTRYEGGGRTLKVARYVAATNALKALGMCTKEDEELIRKMLEEAEQRYNAYQKAMQVQGVNIGGKGLGPIGGPTGDIRNSFVAFKRAAQPLNLGVSKFAITPPMRGGRGRGGRATAGRGGPRARGRGRGAAQAMALLNAYSGFGETYDYSTQAGYDFGEYAQEVDSSGFGLVEAVRAAGLARGARGARGVRGAAQRGRGARGARGALAFGANKGYAAAVAAGFGGLAGAADYSYEAEGYGSGLSGYEWADTSATGLETGYAEAATGYEATGLVSYPVGSVGARGLAAARRAGARGARGARGAALGAGVSVLGSLKPGRGRGGVTAAAVKSDHGIAYNSYTDTSYTGYDAYGGVVGGEAVGNEDWGTGQAGSYGAVGGDTYGANTGYEIMDTSLFTDAYGLPTQPMGAAAETKFNQGFAQW